MGIRSLKTASIATGVKRSKVWDQSTSIFDSDYFSIASYTISDSTTATFDFQSIPQDYKHLQIRLFGQGLTSDDSVLKFNNDSGTSYSWHELRGNGTAAGVSGTASLSNWSYIGRTPTATQGDYFGVVVCDIPDYTRTDRQKMHYSIEGVDFSKLSQAQKGRTIRSFLFYKENVLNDYDIEKQ
jgi:hypothetical protein